MKTELNEDVEKFFSNTKLEDITIENIKEHFKDINKVNEYGGLIHAAVHNKFTEENVLKFIEVLLENGVDVNLKGERTGYSFIHLALYGYTEEDEVNETYNDYSYSTDFIVELIKLGRKYGLDVGIVDDDSDSLIHTALASEVYTGSVIELIDALGIEFDVSCKDGNGMNIYQALLQYKEEATSTNNEIWLDKLNKEALAIERRVEVSKFNLDEINEELAELKTKFEELTRNTQINYILEKYEYINELHARLDFCISAKETVTELKEQEFSKIWEGYSTLLKKIIIMYIEEISNKPDSLKIDNLLEIVTSFDFLEVKVDLEKVKEDYQNRINLFKKNIADAETLAVVKQLEEKLTCFYEEKIIKELKDLLSEKRIGFEEIIQKIKKQFDLLILVNVWLEGENKNTKDEIFTLKDDYLNMSLEELDKLNLDLVNVIAKNKDLIKQVIAEKFEKLLNSLYELDSNDILEISELLEIFDNKIHLEKEKQKINKRNKNESN